MLIAIASACARHNHLSDPTLVTIADLKDRRQADSLVHFLLDKNPVYRVAAAMAFGSVQDSVAALQLGNMLLEDPVDDARIAAAFALGQTSCIASGNALIPAMHDKNPKVVCEVLEALGKTIRLADLQVLKSFKATDSLSETGLARAFYQLGLRGLADSVITEKESEFLRSKHSYSTRLAAAHFFSRAQKIKVNPYASLLLALSEDGNVFVRMASVAALRKLDSAKVIEPLIKILQSDKDYRVRVSAARALASFASPRANKILLTALADENINVPIAIVESLKPNSFLYDDILRAAHAAPQWRVRANLLKLAIELKPSSELEKEIQQQFRNSKNHYEQAALLLALSGQPTSFEFIRNELLGNAQYVIKTTAAQALATLNQKAPKEKVVDFLKTYQEAILQGDAAVIGIVCSALQNPSLGFKEVVKDISFLRDAKNKLSMPKDVESMIPLEEAIAYFEGREKPKKVASDFNHPIDWEKVRSIPVDQQVKIDTDKGEIILQLLVEEAPGSVANFVDLAGKKYFDGKNFHRVVPNFVIQGGCNRGDGYGSEDYSIRSEFGLRRYSEGCVGMASAGKDTEGTQWFITHSPTPHLDGRYTIFATVKKGMDVVHAIEVGDKIRTVELIQ